MNFYKSRKGGSWLQQFFLVVLLVVAPLYCGVSRADDGYEKLLLIPVHIEKGTSLIQLTKEYCTSVYHWKEIAKINELSAPFKVYEGDTVRIPYELLKKERISAKIASVIGGVFRMQQDGALKAVKEGEEVRPGQTLITEKDGFAHIVLPDNKYIRVSCNSRFTFTYLFRLKDQSLKTEFFLEQGNISVDVRQKLKENETFNTRTPISVTGVRGTSYRVKMDGETSVVETLRGRVALSAGGSMVMVKAGMGSTVKKGAPPSQPEELPAAPTIPEMKKMYRSKSFHIPSPAVEEGSCRLRISEDEAGEHTAWQGQADNGEDFVVTGLADGSYNAFFTAVNAARLEGKPAGSVGFTLRALPADPVLFSHCDGKAVFGTSFDISWMKGDGAASYLVQVAKDEQFQNLLTEKSVVQTRYLYENAAPGTYYFRVRAVADDGFQTDFSRTDKVVLKEQPALSEIKTPAAGEDLVLHWKEAGEGALYDIDIAKDKDFSHIVSSAKNLKTPDYQPHSLKGGTYWVRIRTILPTGESPWSPAGKLEIPRAKFSLAEGVMIGVFIVITLL